LSRGLTQLRVNTAALGPHYDRFLDDLCDEAVVEGTVYMKTHARWRDDTGNRKDRIPGAARAGLSAVRSDDSQYLQFGHTHKEIVFSHGVSYGIWLETKHHGKFAIIMQSVKAVGESFMAKLEQSLDRVAREQ
jgi:hypothetical protein